MVHPLFDEWFGIKATEYHMPRPSDRLVCLTDAAKNELRSKSLNDVMSGIGKARVDKARAALGTQSPESRREILRAEWSKLLGPISPGDDGRPSRRPPRSSAAQRSNGSILEEIEAKIVVPLVVLTPAKREAGHASVLRTRRVGQGGLAVKEPPSAEIGEASRAAGVIVVLARPARHRRDPLRRHRAARIRDDTEQSTHVQLFGETLLGERLRDLRSVMAYLRTRPDVDGKPDHAVGRLVRVAFDQLREGRHLQVPHGVDCSQVGAVGADGRTARTAWALSTRTT